MSKKTVPAAAEGKESAFTNAVVNGTVLTMDGSLSVHAPGMVLFQGNRITYTGPWERKIADKLGPEAVIDAKGGIILPGFINTHTHAGMSFFRTLADDKADRLRKFIFPLEKEFVTPKLVYWATLHTISEMLLGGTTTFADMYFFEEMSAEAALYSGIRAVTGESVTSFPSPDASGFDRGMERTEELAEYLKDSERVTAAVAPHAPYSLDRGDLEKTAEFSETRGIPVLSHLAEMPFEEEYTLEKYGMRPVPYYDSCGLLTGRSLMAHCIFADESDRKLILERNTGVSHNPSANAKSGKGIAPAFEFFSEGLRAGLGTDGPMSGNTMDMINILGITSKLQKIRFKDPSVMNPVQVLQMATAGGARALHMEKTTGSLEPGKYADITVISVRSPSMFPVYDPYSAVVYCASPSDVDTVIADGKVLVKDGKLTAIDTEAVREASSSFISKIRKESGRIT